MKKIIHHLLAATARKIYGLRFVPWVNRILARESLLFSGLQGHERMLADSARVDTYHRAITKHVKPGDRVIDLGTGTGLLAAFAARAGAAMVYALEITRIIEKARRIASHNKIETIEFVHTSCFDFKLEEPVDVIIHEQIGSMLFNEDMVAKLLDLRERVLRKGGLILPARFELFLEPVKTTDAHRVPFVWEQNLHGLDFSCLRDEAPTRRPKDLSRSVGPHEIDYFLCVPEPVLSCDLQTMGKGDLPPIVSYTRPVLRTGRLDGFLLYFKAYFDADICLCDWDPGIMTSWQLPLLRVDALQFEVGQSLGLELQVERWEDFDTWRWKAVPAD